RCAQARPGGRRAGARVRPTGALRAARRVQAPCAHGRAVRRRCPPRCAPALKTRLAAEGLFAEDRKRPLPFLPRRIGVVTGNDAAAKRDVVTTIRTRFPPASLLVAETYVQGPRAAGEIVSAITALGEAP